MRRMLATIVLLLGAAAARSWTLDAGLPTRLSAQDLARGKALYEAHCQRCHGPDGDHGQAEGITPLGGLSLRLGDPRNRNFGGPAFRARGRVYPPEEASALMGYILTLRGEKGFARPEALVSPTLLERKQSRRTYVVIDARSRAEFRKGHVGSAVNLPPSTLAAFRKPRLAPDLAHRIVIVYDQGDGRNAASIWRALHDSGHRDVAVLDGGYQRWTAEEREISTAISASSPRKLFVESAAGRESAATLQDGPPPVLRIDWRKTITQRGLVPASELGALWRSAGFAGPGRYALPAGDDAADLLAFQLHLMGYTVEKQSAGLTVR
jgi:rhodanese-related sulfurtransferase